MNKIQLANGLFNRLESEFFTQSNSNNPPGSRIKINILRDKEIVKFSVGNWDYLMGFEIKNDILSFFINSAGPDEINSVWPDKRIIPKFEYLVKEEIKKVDEREAIIYSTFFEQPTFCPGETSFSNRIYKGVITNSRILKSISQNLEKNNSNLSSKLFNYCRECVLSPVHSTTLSLSTPVV